MAHTLTREAPLAFRSFESAWAVAPVVMTSSTIATCPPDRRSSQRNAARRLARRCLRPRPGCGGVSRTLASDALGEAKREPSSHREVARVLESVDQPIDGKAVLEGRDRFVEGRLVSLALAARSGAAQRHRATRTCGREHRQRTIAILADEHPRR